MGSTTWIGQSRERRCFFNLFTEPARTSFFLNTSDRMTYDDMVQMKMEKYDSEARKEQVLTADRTLNLIKGRSEEFFPDEHDKLTSILNLFHKITVQCPPEF